MMTSRMVEGAAIALAVGAAVILTPGEVGAAPLDPAQWSWRAPLETTGVATGFVRLEAAPELIDVASPYLTDVRVVRNGATEVPRLILPRQDTGGVTPLQWTSGARRNAVYEPKQYARVDVELPDTPPRNVVRVSLSGDSFRRRVRVEGSDDGTSWAILRDDQWLFSLPASQAGPLRGGAGATLDAPVRADIVELPLNDFRHLRVTAWNMPEDPDQIEILAVEAPATPPAPPRPSVAVTPALLSVNHDTRARTSTWEFDLGTRNLVITHLSAHFSDPYFYRPATVSTRNQTTETYSLRTETGTEPRERPVPWSAPAGPRVLYRIRDGERASEQTNLPTDIAPARYVRLMVENGDNPPLKLERLDVERQSAWVAFDASAAAADGQLELLAGNPAASEPNYDLGQAVRGITAAQLPEVAMGRLLAQGASTRLAPWSERHATIIYLALAAAAAALATVLLNNLRHTGPNKED